MEHRITATDRRQMPWKNGLGLTEEIAIFPQGSTVDGFFWRVSMAHVTRDSAFSCFPGITRHMALFEGAMQLQFPDRPSVRLTPDGPIETFSGTDPVTSHVVSGPVRDLNIMTRDTHFTARLTHGRTGQPWSFHNAPEVGFIIATGAVIIETQKGRVELSRYDALQIDRPGKNDVYRIIHGNCYFVEIFPTSVQTVPLIPE